MAEDRDIKYVDREFGDLKEQLIEFAKNYFPDTYNDFSETAPGTMFIEMAAYVGDVLSFYQDMQLQETFIQYAKDPKNLYKLAYMMGYRPKTTTAAEVELEVTQRVSAISGSAYAPDWSQALTVDEDTVILSDSAGNIPFLIDQKIDFSYSSSYDPTEITVYSLSGGEPAEYQLKKKVKAFSGKVNTITRTFTSAEKFKTITIEDSDIIGILSISGSTGNSWYEVPFLGQETVVIDESNSEDDANNVPYLLTLQKTPRRYTTRFTSEGYLELQFGAGTTGQDDSAFIPDPTNVGSGTNQGVSRRDYAYDPSNFLYTQTYGLAPSNTTLTIKYLTGGGVASNVPANSLTNFTATVTGDATAQTTLAFNNPKAATGGKDGDSVEELRQNSLRAFAEQGRVVTLSDYVVRAMSLPAKYGTVGKVYAVRDQLESTQSTTDNIIDSNPLAISLYVLAYDNNGKLTTATKNLKKNLRTYLSEYMILTDALSIKDAFIVNIGVDFDILVKPNYNGRDVLLNCTAALKEHFHITKWGINQPINTSSIQNILYGITGVQAVQKVKITNNAGGNYSEYGYDVEGATRNGIVYPSYDTMIFEVKYPNRDIRGRITSL